MDQTDLDLLLGITASQSSHTDIEKLRSRAAERRGSTKTPSVTSAHHQTSSASALFDSARPTPARRTPTATRDQSPTRSRLYEPIAESQPYGIADQASYRYGQGSESRAETSRPPTLAAEITNGGTSLETAVKQRDYAPSSFSAPTDDAAQRMLESLLSSLHNVSLDITASDSTGGPIHIDVTAPTQAASNPLTTGVGSDRLDTGGEKPRQRFRIITVKSRLPGSRRRRIGYRVIRRRAAGEGYAADVEEGAETDDPPNEPTPEPPTPFQQQLNRVFAKGVLAQVENLGRTDNTLGNHLPSQFRDIFTALSDLSTAVDIANHIRGQLDLSPLSMRTDRVALRRAVAQMRLALYTELVAALALPLAPDPTPVTDDEDEKVEIEKISLTPSSLKYMAQTLPTAFPRENYAIKRFLANDDAPYGERKGKVVWTQGIGKMVGGDPMGPGFRGKTTNEGSVHVFVDHSNVLFGLMNHLHKLDTRDLPPRHLRTLSLPVMSLLLRRGRLTPHGTLHLVASSPLHQNLDPLVRLGWEVSILKRVEVYEDEVLDASATKMIPKPQQQSALAKQGLSVGGGGLRRYREQGVDEILHLKLLQALNSSEAPTADGSTIVLATGDAKGGQFNRDGFLGAVREAIKRGWAVELWSFSEGLSHTWRDVKRKEKWDGKLTIKLFDEWATQMVEVGESH